MAEFSIFFQYSDTTLTKQFCPIFYVFFAKAQSWNTKKLLKTEHQCKTSVLAFKKTFVFKVNLWPKNGFFFQNSETILPKPFFLHFFFMFSVLISRIEHQKVIENQTPVYFCHEFYNFLSILGPFCCFAA